MTPITIVLEDGTALTLKYGWVAIMRAEHISGKPLHRMVGDCGATDLAAMIIAGAHTHRFKSLDDLGELLSIEKWVHYAEQVARALKRDMPNEGTPGKVIPFKIVKGDDDGDPGS